MSARTSRWRAALTIGVVATFCVMLVGTSKPRDDEGTQADDAKADAKAHDAKTDAKAPPTVPATDGWAEAHVDAAGVKLKLLEGASLGDGGNDASFAGRYLRVRMPSGVEVYFAQDTGGPVDLAEKRAWYQDDASGFVGIVLEAPDAIVAHRTEGEPVGEYWEVTACSAPIDGKPLCTVSAGALVDGEKVVKMTYDEVLAVVAIARSIAPK